MISFCNKKEKIEIFSTLFGISKIWPKEIITSQSRIVLVLVRFFSQFILLIGRSSQAQKNASQWKMNNMYPCISKV